MFGSKVKYNLVDFFKDLCDKTNISNYTLGMYIRAYHICLPIGFIFVMLFGPKLIAAITLFILFILLFLYISLNGCILTSLEKKLCNDKFTFIDIFLEIAGIEVNEKNQFSMSIKLASLYVIFAIFIYYYRFILEDKYKFNYITFLKNHLDE